jgi:RND family efflux transporter MFP subunit
LISNLDFKKAQIAATELAANFEVEKQRYEFAKRSMAPRLAVAQTELDQAKAQADLHHSQVDALQVRAGMNGVLQQIAVDVGQRVAAGTNLARVADNTKLKAQIKIPENQARDIAVSQTAQVDMRNGSIVTGTVSRVDPAVREGTVLVDVTFHAMELPKGARPDLSVEGTIELERLADAVYVGRPAFGQDDSTIGLFKLSPDGVTATRIKVKLGRGSATKVVIEGGLTPGDRVILSDTSVFDNLLIKVKELPGVVAAGINDCLPFWNTDYEMLCIAGQLVVDPGRLPWMQRQIVSSDYFLALGIPLLRGRFFDNRDQPAGENSVIIGESIAQRYFPGQDPIGKQLDNLGHLLRKPRYMGLSQRIAGILFNTSATDFISIGASILVLCLTACIACLLPALRATRINPTTTLRE